MTLVPTIFIRAVFRVAAGVACSIFLDDMVGIYACAVAENSAVVVKGGVGFATTA